MSAKGLKATPNDDTDDSSDTSEADNLIYITGGNFVLNTADDAIHSDAYVELTGGSFYIQTGDDGVHADTTLKLGEGGADNAGLYVKVARSYEGLEAGTVNIYSGCFDVAASDDGINAAGGSSDGGNPGGGPGGGFNPGGGGPGGGWGGGGFGPGGGGGGRLFANGTAVLSAADYSINIYGGRITVNADGDGLDSNGDLNISGGSVLVWGQEGGHDNEPLDYDGSMDISGGVVFAAGGPGMGGTNPSISQAKTTSTSTFSSGTLICVMNGSTVVFSATAPKRITYALYSAPGAGSYKISSGSGNANLCSAMGHMYEPGTDTATCTEAGTVIHTCTDCGATTTTVSPAKGHSYGPGAATTEPDAETEGVLTYTCALCGGTETEALPAYGDLNATAEDETDEGYTVTFITDGNCTINVYYTKDYGTANEIGATSTVSRNDSGTPDSGGDGQVNFAVVLSNGYAVDAISIEGTYKNLKEPADTGADNTYRITKIGSDLTVKVTTQASGGTETATESFRYTRSDDGTLSLSLKYSVESGLTADTAYTVITAFYSNRKMLEVAIESGAVLDAEEGLLCLDLADLTCPDSFDSCKIFVLVPETFAPACAGATAEEA